MTDNLKQICISENIPGQPSIVYSHSKNELYHVYEHVPLQTDNFQAEIKSYVSRKQSFSGNVLTVHKIKDEKISYNLGNPSMEISIMTQYIPWRLHLQQANLTFEQGMFIIDGACKGFRELLHRIRIPFEIQQSMIGIDGNGKVKVWWNQYFYKSKMKFPIFQPIKLKTMIKSLVLAIQSRMNSESVNQLQAIIQGCENFQLIEQRIKLNSKGLKLQYFGKKLIKNLPEFQIISSQIREESILSKSKSDTSISLTKLPSFNEKSPIKHLTASTNRQIPIQFSKKPAIRKRHLDHKNSIGPNDKIKLIKSDIEDLRQSSIQIDKSRNNEVSNKLRTAKSVGSLHSYNLGISENKNIPEIKKIIAQQKMFLDQKSLIKVSKFVQPKSNLKLNPQHLNLTNELNDSRSYLSRTQLKSKGSIFLPELKSAIFNSKEIIQTDRTYYESKRQKAHEYYAQNRFGQSGKKTTEVSYLTSAFDI